MNVRHAATRGGRFASANEAGRHEIVGVVVYDRQMAQVVDRAGVDIVSVGDSVGVNMWGQESDLEVTLDQMLLACTAVRRGVQRALVSCDVPYGPLQGGPKRPFRRPRG